MESGKEELYSQNYACPEHGVSIEELSPRMFSFNNPFGACPECSGLGFKKRIDPNLVIKDKTKTLREGAMNVTGWNLDSAKMADMYLSALAKRYGFSMDVPVKDLPEHIYNMLLYGNGGERIKIQSMATFKISDVNRAVSECVGVPVIASGGAGAKSHFLDAFNEGKADAVLTASLFHFNEIPIMDLKHYLKDNGISVRL